MASAESGKLSGNSLVCPHCGADLDAGKIPDKWRHNYLPMVKVGDRFEPIKDDGRPLHFSRVMGTVVGDRVQIWRCPSCGAED